jgi:hypothetical protein
MSISGTRARADVAKPFPEHGRTNPHEGNRANRREDQHSKPRRGRSWLVLGIRYVLPAAVFIAGVIVMSLGGESEVEGGAAIVAAGLSIYFFNWFARIGVSSENDRDREAAARDYYSAHGRWPS